MDNKKLFEAAMSAKMSDYPFSDTETIMNNIRERAKNMKTEENVRQVKFTEITPEYAERKKSHKTLNVFAGVAGTAAVLTGAVFGLNWLNEHGGLKGPDVQGAGAGYHEDITEPAITTNALAAAEIAAEELPDIREAFDKPVEFGDSVIILDSAGYDGEKLYAVFNVQYTGSDFEKFDFAKLKVLGTDIDDYNYESRVEPVGDEENGNYTCTYTMPLHLDTGKPYSLNIQCFSGSSTGEQKCEQDTQDYSFIYEPKNTAIKIDFLGERDLGDYEFEYYIDGEYQNKDIVTKDMSVQQDFEWSVKGSGILTYRVDVRSASTQRSGTWFECTVDFSKDEPTKDFGDSFNAKIFKELADTPAAGEVTKPANDINISDTIEFSDCTVNVSSIERYGNTIKLTLDAYAKENCDIQYTNFIIDETGERTENKNRIPWLNFFDWSDWTEVAADHLQVTFVLRPYLPEGTERTFVLRKGKVTTYDAGETAYFTITGADTSGAYVREINAVGTGLAGVEMPIDRIEIDPLSISFDVIGSYAFETEFSIKFRDGRIYTYNKEARVCNGRTWEDQNGNIICSTELDSVHIADDGDYFEEKDTGKIRYFIFAEDPIFDVNEIESITILGAEIPITTE